MLNKTGFRFAIATVFLALSSGCSVTGNLTTSGNVTAHKPNKIYLRDEFFRVNSRREMDRYVCLNGPLICDQFAMMWQCACSADMSQAMWP